MMSQSTMDPIVYYRIIKKMEKTSIEDQLKWMLTRGSIVPDEKFEVADLEEVTSKESNVDPKKSWDPDRRFCNIAISTRSQDAATSDKKDDETRKDDSQDSVPLEWTRITGGNTSMIFGQEPNTWDAMSLYEIVKFRPDIQDSEDIPYHFTPEALDREARMHSLIMGTFRRMNISVHVPHCSLNGYTHNLPSKFDPLKELIAKKTPEGEKSIWDVSRKLAIEQVFPLPKPTRLALMKKYCPARPAAAEVSDSEKYVGRMWHRRPGTELYDPAPATPGPFYEEARQDAKNRDCLVRPLLGSHHHRSSKAAMKPFSLQNFELHFFDLIELGMQNEMMRYAHSMADALAVLHWDVCCDARGIEFAIGAKKVNKDAWATELPMLDFGSVEEWRRKLYKDIFDGQMRLQEEAKWDPHEDAIEFSDDEEEEEDEKTLDEIAADEKQAEEDKQKMNVRFAEMRRELIEDVVDRMVDAVHDNTAYFPRPSTERLLHPHVQTLWQVFEATYLYRSSAIVNSWRGIGPIELWKREARELPALFIEKMKKREAEKEGAEAKVGKKPDAADADDEMEGSERRSFDEGYGSEDSNTRHAADEKSRTAEGMEAGSQHQLRGILKADPRMYSPPKKTRFDLDANTTGYILGNVAPSRSILGCDVDGRMF